MTRRDDVDQLTAAFIDTWPTAASLTDPPGYRDSGLAVIDAVFSIRLRYERVVEVVQRAAQRLGLEVALGHAADDQFGVVDLHQRLSGRDTVDGILDSSYKASGRPKAAIVADVAEALVGIGVETRRDVRDPSDPAYDDQRRAWCSVHGLGPVTHEYFRILNGQEAVKLDVMLTRWIADVLGRTVSVAEGERLLEDVTRRLEGRWEVPVSRRAVDHTIWRHERAVNRREDQ